MNLSKHRIMWLDCQRKPHNDLFTNKKYLHPQEDTLQPILSHRVLTICILRAAVEPVVVDLHKPLLVLVPQANLHVLD